MNKKWQPLMFAIFDHALHDARDALRKKGPYALGVAGHINSAVNRDMIDLAMILAQPHALTSWLRWGPR